MANPHGTPLIDYLHTELDAAIGPANVPLVMETFIDWLVANNRPKNAVYIQLGRSELRARLGLD